MATATANAISLRGSTQTITEYFAYAINEILYLRQVYPSCFFAQKNAYDLTLPVAHDRRLNDYLGQVLENVATWLMTGKVQKIMLVIMAEKPIETWEFNIQQNNTNASDPQRDIEAVMRQISASVSFLPVIREKVTFDLQIHADQNVEIPENWEQTQGAVVSNGQQVDFRSFETGVHQVGTKVVYEERGMDL